MVKFIKSWKFILSVTFFVLYLIYFSTVYIEEMKLPSEGWSRDIFIEEFKTKDMADLMNSNNIFTIPIESEENFLTFWPDGSKLNYSLIDINGNIIEKNQIDINIGIPKKMEGKKEAETIIIYSLENKELKEYKINWKTKKISNIKTLDNNIKDFIYRDNLLIYSGENYIKIIEDSTYEKTIRDILPIRFEAIKYDEIYHIALAERNNKGQRFLKYLLYDPENKTIKKYDMDILPNRIGNIIERLDIGIIDDKINILVSNTGAVYSYDFPIDKASEVNKTRLKIKDNYPTPYIIRNKNDKLQFVASVQVLKGRNKKTTNLVLFTVNDGKIENKKLLTKTNAVSIRPQYFTLKGEDYLQWTDIAGKDKRILLSSSNQEIIKTSTKIRTDILLDIFMATISSIIPIIYLSLVPFVYIFLPSISLIIIASIFKLTWVENNPMKVFNIALIVHLLAKLTYTRNSVLYNEKIHRFSPVFLKSTFGIFTAIVITTAISLYCVYNYFKTSEGKVHFLKPYIYFSIVDISIYCFLTVPYVYTYLNLTYLVNA